MKLRQTSTRSKVKLSTVLFTVRVSNALMIFLQFKKRKKKNYTEFSLMNNFFIIFYYFSFLQLLQSSLLFVYFFRSHIPSQASTKHFNQFIIYYLSNISFISLVLYHFYLHEAYAHTTYSIFVSERVK